MAYFSDIAQAFTDNKRIRTQSYRGSLLVTTCEINFSSEQDDQKPDNSVVIVAPISYSSSIKSIKFFSGVLPANNVKIGIHGVDKDGHSPISDNVLGDNVTLTMGNSWQDILKPNMTVYTLYELLHTYDAFKKYEKHRHGLLTFTFPAGSSLNGNAIVEIQHVDSAPSDAPLVFKTVDAQNNKDMLENVS